MVDASSNAAPRRSGGCAGCSGVVLAAVVVIAIGIVAATWIFAGAVGSVAQSAADAVGRLADAFKPQVNIQTAVRAAVGKLDPQLRLKVAERELEVTVEDLEETRWLGVPVGATVTRFRSTGNLVQYVVPLDGLTPERMEFIGSDGRGALLVHLPAPRVDGRMVYVQVDPGKVEVEVDDQWLNNVNPFVGDGSERARAAVRNAAVELASQPAYLKEIEDECAPRIEALLQSLLAPVLADGVEVRVLWDR
jgi:hypothetical protein